MNTILVANIKGGCGKTMIATTLAAALANRGLSVALADADPQQSSMLWLKLRPKQVAHIDKQNWRKEKNIGKAPKDSDYLIIDAPGALDDEHSKQLIAECQALLVPILPSVFDVESSKRFLAQIEEIKRIRKGKVAVHLLANRVRVQTNTRHTLEALFDELEQPPLTWISEKTLYPQLAEHGLAIFDGQQKPLRDAQAQWQPIIEAIY